MSTSRPFAYNTGSSIPGTEQVGDLAIGFPSAGFASTGLEWWNGADEDLGYVIASPVPDDSQPTPEMGNLASIGFYRTDSFTNESFIALSEYIARVISNDPQNFTTGADAKTWLNDNGYWTSYVSPLVTSGLVLRLNASDPASYSGSGSTWTDLAGSQQNVTLYSSPTYTSGTPSYFTFNGTTQYGLGSGSVLPTTSYTKSFWFYLNAYQDNNIVSGDGHFIFMGDTPSVDKKIYSGHSNWGNYKAYPSAATINLNTWYYAALTFNTTDGMKLYINGVLDSSYTANKGAHPGTGTINVATFNGGNLMNGRISKVYCYNTSLTGPEVLQNFNADKSEFGL
jgi:hypothetical protein